MIELAGLSIPAQLAAGQPLRDGERDDFPDLAKRLGDPAVVGIIVGSPVYFGNMSALCKAFLDRCGAFRSDKFKLRNKVAGVLAVGSARNGGQGADDSLHPDRIDVPGHDHRRGRTALVTRRGDPVESERLDCRGRLRHGHGGKSRPPRHELAGIVAR
ncbi:flavodoxin family protein [bacterium]|nr:flavodoxin family protein [bacterium]